jgi:tRNA modification GTPase
MDLTAVEGLADLVAAETEAQRRQAFLQLKGLLGERAERWRQQLIEAVALVEAGIDFSDEGDVPSDLMARSLELIRPLADDIGRALARQGERLREGLRVAIAGPPNAGKSTLFNRLARREAAIVSPFPGTTRDVLELHLDLGGYPVTVFDTAGIRDTHDPVEREGVRRASEQAAAADLLLWIVDATAPAGPLAEVPTAWVVVNKMDLTEPSEKARIESRFKTGIVIHFISSATGAGVDKLVDAISGFAQHFFTVAFAGNRRGPAGCAAGGAGGTRGNHGRAAAARDEGVGSPARPGGCRGRP